MSTDRGVQSNPRVLHVIFRLGRGGVLSVLHAVTHGGPNENTSAAAAAAAAAVASWNLQAGIRGDAAGDSFCRTSYHTSRAPQAFGIGAHLQVSLYPFVPRHRQRINLG